MDDQTIELKPCPFCGGAAEMRHILYGGETVRCTVCGAEGPLPVGKPAGSPGWTKQGAALAWNGRDASQPPRQAAIDFDADARETLVLETVNELKARVSECRAYNPERDDLGRADRILAAWKRRDKAALARTSTPC